MTAIAIISTKNDLHPYSVQKYLKAKGAQAYIVNADSISSRKISWYQAEKDNFCRIESVDGDLVSPRDLDVIWWRRGAQRQETTFDHNSPQGSLLDRDSSAALLGALFTQFCGTWVNDPLLTERADNKLLQLKIAKEVGLKIPRTLVSNEPEEVKKFCESLNFNVIAKPVRGATNKILFTQPVMETDLQNETAILVCPTIYQENIRGSKHVRAHCFGNRVISVLIESQNLDWRVDLGSPFSLVQLERATEVMILDVLKRLGLKMGMVDLKFDPDGIPYWLEINAQGQFLFCEALADLELRNIFADFLIECAQSTVKT